MGDIGEAGGLDRIRKIGESALTAAGKHVGQGLLIWSAVREFENAVLSSMQVRVLRKSINNLQVHKHTYFSYFACLSSASTRTSAVS